LEDLWGLLGLIDKLKSIWCNLFSMKQYQISLDAKSFGVLDELEGILKIPKTTIIQQSLIKFKRQFSQASKSSPKTDANNG
jgi:hypothetical protein